MDGAGLTIVVPALNEEEAIGATVARCLAARDEIKQTAGLAFVEIIVVSDGSTDRTAEIARGFEEIELVVFAQNRGYGAAIKEGWKRGRGDWLGFLDADGTCDPIHFGRMCRLGTEQSADIVLGSRLGPDSQMPKLRRFGNRVYALLLSLLCGRRVTDTASGMRVVRRGALDHLYPLPDGLHFTPSMSARAMLNGLCVIETPMPYGRRIGKSKLNVLTDGVVFLRTILSGVLCYRPEKVFLLGCVLAAVFIVILAAQPVQFYYQTRRLEEWMIYRFVVCHLLGSFGLLLLLAAALANRMAYFSPRRPEASRFRSSTIAAMLRSRALAVIVAVLLVSALLFLWPGIVQYATTGTISLHWSRLLAGAFSLFSLLQTAVFAVLMKVVEIWQVQRER